MDPDLGPSTKDEEPALRPRTPARQWAWAVVAVATSTVVGVLTRSFFSIADQAMLFLVAVLFAASRLARGPSLLTAFLSVAALDFFFVEPYYTFAVGDHRFLITFAVLFGVAVLVSHLTHRVVDQAEAARRRERRTAALYEASQRAVLAEEAERSRAAIETEKMRSTLLSAVSHDLRTPLASISGAAAVLADEQAGLGEPQRRELLESIRDEARRLDRLVNDLLELTRLESGTFQVKKEWVPLEEVVSSALGRLGARLEGRDVRVSLPDEMLMAPVDPVLLEQVFVNLLENAAKYSPAGASIEIRGRTASGEVVVEIADRGTGLPPGEEDRVFERFYRVADGGRAEGTGLGLAVCRAVVKAHGGRIEAQNRPDGGAILRFTMPLEGPTPP